MATAIDKRSDNRRQSGRLQRRAPASLQINREPVWNVAIPLLSPLATSPEDRILEVKPKEEPSRQEQKQKHQQMEQEKQVFKKWQHPAAPFCYESATLMPYFVG